jgi:iron complex outermembrane recepter protein
MKRAYRPMLTSLALSTTALVSLFAMTGTASAQTSEEQETQIVEDKGEIVVTARNRAESVQTVPLSITAMSKETLEKKSVQGMDDVARFTPGLSFESYSGGFQAPVIRAQTQTLVTALESNVATFLDGIYLPRSWTVDLGVSSLERVEVVKGPQSARYGRNAFAGAINYISYKAKVGGDVTGEATGTVGDNKRFDYGIQANLPIGDRFAIAGTYNHSQYDGSWDNTSIYRDIKLDPGTSGKIGGWDNTAWSVSARAEPTDGMVFEANYLEFDIKRESNPNNSLVESAGQLNCGAIRSGFRALYCGEVPSPPDKASADPRSYGAVTNTQILRLYGSYEFLPNLTASYLFGRITGNVDIANLTEADNFDCGTTCTYQNAPIGSVDYDSNEFRLTYDANGIRVAGGAFSSKGRDYYRFDVITATPITPGSTVLPLGSDPANVRTTNANTLTTTRVNAVFGEFQWTGVDGRLRLGAEARYTWTDLATLNRTTNVGYQRDFKVLTPRFTAEFDLARHSMLYASAAKGTKAGGFNATAVLASDKTFDEEKNWTYEIGSKNRFFDNHLTFNVALFYTDWKDIQINSPDTGANNPNAVNITKNLGNATVYGIELDAVLAPTRNLSFDANFSYSHGEYSDGTRDSRFSRTVSPCDNVVCSTTGAIGGNQTERTPRSKGALGAQWSQDLNWKNGSFFVRADGTWQDKFFTTPANEAWIPARTLVNLRTGITYDRFDLQLWARNVLDKKYVSNAYVVVLPFGNSYQLFYGQRRSMGATLKVKY